MPWGYKSKNQASWINKPKNQTNWTNKGKVAYGDFLLLENGDFLLQENDYRIILEQSETRYYPSYQYQTKGSI